MKNRFFHLFLALAVVMSLAGCGSSTGTKAGGGATLTAASTEFPNGALLVTADSVQSSINAGAVATGASSTGKIVIVDARTSGYGTSHIPGAINVLHSAYWTKGSGLKPLATLESQLGGAGITRDAKIVIYDNTTASEGAAGRIFWMLEYLGCTDVHILNGGWDKWIVDGHPTQTTPVTLAVATFTSQVDNSKKTTSDHIANRLYDQDFAVVDSRSDEEYIGWKLNLETRGGHITGAISMPYAWSFNSDKTSLDFESLRQLFESRGITQDKEVAACSTDGIQSGYAYFLLRLMGYPRCSNYDASIRDWADNTSYPMDYAKNYQQLVYPGWVQQLIATGSAPTLPAGNNYKIFQCDYGASSTDYDSHIPGAIYFDTNNVEARDYLDPDNPFPLVLDANEKVWDLVSDALLEARFAAMGVSNTTTVIVYGTTPYESIAAARVYWAMRYAGVDVRYLNGRMDYWKANGGTFDTT
ncbi:MAG TPA: rhodanese-like domain-containing protein, partial [Geobacteraceae bacterium]|nr:rhodanese-like domain-containing protein [Geobacteraceae bacterium]